MGWCGLPFQHSGFMELLRGDYDTLWEKASQGC